MSNDERSRLFIMSLSYSIFRNWPIFKYDSQASIRRVLNAFFVVLTDELTSF